MPVDSQEKELSLVELIREKYAQIAAGDYFALLGIDRTADIEKVREAYFKLARVLHPDAIGRQGLREFQKEAVEIFKAVSEAYHVLSDRRRRAEYEARLAQGKEAAPVDDRPQRDREQEARIFAHKGTLLAQRRLWGEAAGCFKRAVELDPKSIRFMLQLGFAIMQNTALPERPRMEEAKLWFEKAHQEAETDPEPYYYLSLYYKAIGDVVNQRKMLEECLNLNPKHVNAQRESRLLAMRMAKKSATLPFIDEIRKMFSKLTKK